ncbi:hypothetical protein DY000_02003545 [Brassica cretica]|uniref:Uncharacterized protein n=1 Tax=Brassica cretica TaxID=69181 RepID=A0ABQ7CK48_BRACR|nr:hypothetical protein DY000_02003545 [Brassica cretica]
MDELFTGVQGKGAFLNGKPIKGWNFIYFSHTLQSRDFVGQDENNVLFFIVSTQSELVTALLLAEAGVKRDKATLDDATNRINSLLTKVRNVRICGSCALDLCSVACGRADIFYEIEFGGPW